MTAKFSAAESDVHAIEHHTAHAHLMSFCSVEVEIQVRPRDALSRALKMSGDDTQDSGAHFSISVVRSRRHSKVSTQNINTLLPVLRPIISQPSHRIYPGKSRSGLIIS